MSSTNHELSREVSDFISGGSKQLFIDNQWQDAASGETFETLDPAHDTAIVSCASAGNEDVDRAAHAARRALAGPWSDLTPAQRGRLLLKLADAVEEKGDVFAELDTLDNGKPLSMTREEDLPFTVDLLRYYAGWATKVEGETIPASAGDFLVYTPREPVGVVGQIIPWNYPIFLAAMKLAPALACGCTVILKPAEQTPLSALLLAQLIEETGFPAGVVNILTGLGDTAGAAIAHHPDIDCVVFTGSTEVGRSIQRAAAGSIKRVVLELGGKSPNIIFADAKLDAAIEGAATGAFYNMGQDCCAGSRIFVERTIYDEVVEGLANKARALTLGCGFDAGVDHGPLVSQEQLDRVLGFVRGGIEEGAVPVTGGEHPDMAGYFVQPTVFRDVSNEMKIAREEIFGPVASVIPFDSFDDAIAQANDTAYGLASGVWTENIRKAHRAALALRAGTVWVNTYMVFDPAVPTGGYKQSGIGREFGKANLDAYTQTKSVWIDLS